MNVLHEDQVEAIKEEIKACEQAQRWAVGATRTKWVDQLVNILEAEDKKEAQEAIKEAEDKAIHLATVVAKGKLDFHEVAARILEKIYDEDIEVEDKDMDALVADHGLVKDLVEIVRRYGLDIDEAVQGERDGYVINAKEAKVFATARTWVEDDTHGVEIDMLTEEVREWRW